MIEFKIQKRSKKSRARIGRLKTPHGEIETPSFVPVATQAAIKTLPSEIAKQTKTQIIIANTFHLHLKPGEKLVKAAGGIHKFMNWDRPAMTDSAGYQVFSLGFGYDFQTGKIAKITEKAGQNNIHINTQPKKIKITDDGVYFTSPIDGKKLFIGPQESIKIQEGIGADIIFAFDECTPPGATYEYVKESLKKTHDWAKICLKTKKSKQALFGIVQGSQFKDLREESAKYINSLGFDGFGIGGEFGANINNMKKILRWTMPNLDENKPRHLLGIGYPKDIETIIKEGVDLFDCTVPTHFARRGVAFIEDGIDNKINLNQTKYLSDKKPLDPHCDCLVCKNYKRNYISHLVRSYEMAGPSLITFHNLYFFNNFVENIRKKIKQGII